MIKKIMYIIVILFAVTPILMIVGSLIYALYIEPIVDIIKNGKKSKTQVKTLIKRFVVLIIIICAVLYYPWIVSVDNGETVCKNFYGITMKCR
jgi:dipeptide/tripeptide permease